MSVLGVGWFSQQPPGIHWYDRTLFGNVAHSPLAGLNTIAASLERSGLKLFQKAAPVMGRYPALTAGLAATAAILTPAGRAIAANLAGGAAYKASQDVVGLFGGTDGNKGADTQADPSRVRRKAATKPRKARKKATHTSRRPRAKNGRAKVRRKKGR